MTERLLLKWGTIKGWDDIESKRSLDLLKRYHELGASMSAMDQRDTPEQKQIILDLIDSVDEIWDDWNGKIMSKDEAKEYVKGDDE
jgi:hypothetical protein